VRYLLKIHILFAKIYEKFFFENPGPDPGDFSIELNIDLNI